VCRASTKPSLYGDHFIYGTSSLAAPEGYPIVQVPAGMAFGTPMGISFFGTAFSEATLIKLASGFEAATKVRAHNQPTFAPTVPFDHIKRTTLKPPHQRGALREAGGSQPASPSNASPPPGKDLKRPHNL